MKNAKTTEDGHTEFLRLPAPIDLGEGGHTLRLVAESVHGWVDPIDWLYLMPDEAADPEGKQTEHTPSSQPVMWRRTQPQ